MLKNVVEARLRLIEKLNELLPDWLNLDYEILFKELEKKLKLTEELKTHILALQTLLKIERLDDPFVWEKLIIGLSNKPYVNFNYPQFPYPAEIALFEILRNKLRPDLKPSEQVLMYGAFLLAIHGLIVLVDELKIFEPYLKKIIKLSPEEMEKLKKDVLEKWQKVKDKKPDELVFEETPADVQVARLKAIQYYGIE